MLMSGVQDETRRYPGMETWTNPTPLQFFDSQNPSPLQVEVVSLLFDRRVRGETTCQLVQEYYWYTGGFGCRRPSFKFRSIDTEI